MVKFSGGRFIIVPLQNNKKDVEIYRFVTNTYFFLIWHGRNIKGSIKFCKCLIQQQ